MSLNLKPVPNAPLLPNYRIAESLQLPDRFKVGEFTDPRIASYIFGSLQTPYGNQGKFTIFAHKLGRDVSFTVEPPNAGHDLMTFDLTLNEFDHLVAVQARPKPDADRGILIDTQRIVSGESPRAQLASKLTRDINTAIASTTSQLDHAAKTLEDYLTQEFEADPSFDRFTQRNYPQLNQDNVMIHHLKFTYFAAYKEGLDQALNKMRTQYYVGSKYTLWLMGALCIISFFAGDAFRHLAAHWK